MATGELLFAALVLFILACGAGLGWALDQPARAESLTATFPGAHTFGEGIRELNAVTPVMLIKADGSLEVDGEPVTLTQAQRDRLRRHIYGR